MIDALTIAAVADELKPLVGGRVQAVVMPDAHSLGLEIYAERKRRYLLLSAHPDAAHVHLTGQKLRRGSDDGRPLELLLRKYVRGARLTGIEQPPYERLLRLSFVGSEGPTTLVGEFMGRYSNLILLGSDERILDSLRRVGPEQSRYRLILPAHGYLPPPPQSKLDPSDLSELALRRALAQSPGPLWRVLVANVKGVSPLLAREVAYRALGDADAQPEELTPVIESFFEIFDHLWSHAWQPCLALDEQSAPVAYAPYPLTQFPQRELVDSMSLAIERYFANARLGYEAAKLELEAVIRSAYAKLERRRERLAEDAAAGEEPEAFRKKGEALLAYAHSVAKGQLSLTILWEEGHLTVELDPRLTAAQNAARYFERYRKAQRTAGHIAAQRAAVTAEADYLDQLAYDLNAASDRGEIEAVRRALQERGYLAVQKARSAPPRISEPRRLVSPGGFITWVGRNAAQNDALCFKKAVHRDLWLHARGVPGAHVVIHNEGQPVPECDLFWAAALAAHYSAAGEEVEVAVDVTERRYIRKVKGAGPGIVTYRNERTLRVAPAAEPKDRR